jgi:YggT family protein
MGLLYTFISVYEVIVLVAALSSWIPSDNVVFQFLREVTEPLLKQIRRVLPAMGGFDFSPLILLLALDLVKRLLAGR